MTRSEPDTDAIVRHVERFVADDRSHSEEWLDGFRAGVEGCARVLHDASNNPLARLALRFRTRSFLRALAAGLRSKVPA